MGPTSTSTAGTITLLTRLAKIVHRRTPEELLGMSLRHFVVLSYLAERGRVPQQELAEVFCMDASNLVLLLNELEDDSLVRRDRDPDDRRRHLVEITDPGLAALAKAQDAREVIEDDVLGPLDADERETLRRLLIKALDG
jgi:DNA-binding MarR family transcriptional regulator